MTTIQGFPFDCILAETGVTFGTFRRGSINLTSKLRCEEEGALRVDELFCACGQLLGTMYFEVSPLDPSLIKRTPYLQMDKLLLCNENDFVEAVARGQHNCNTKKAACAVHAYQNKKCPPDCSFRTCFPQAKGSKEQIGKITYLFTVDNVLKLIGTFKPPHISIRESIIRSIVFESDVRSRNRVGGAHAMVLDLQQQLRDGIAELNSCRATINSCRATKRRRLPSFSTSVSGGFGNESGLGLEQQTKNRNESGLGLDQEMKNSIAGLSSWFTKTQEAVLFSSNPMSSNPLSSYYVCRICATRVAHFNDFDMFYKPGETATNLLRGVFNSVVNLYSSEELLHIGDGHTAVNLCCTRCLSIPRNSVLGLKFVNVAEGDPGVRNDMIQLQMSKLLLWNGKYYTEAVRALPESAVVVLPDEDYMEQMLTLLGPEHGDGEPKAD